MIAVVVPTIRPESYASFRKNWESLFKKHNVTLYTVEDGENPVVKVERSERFGRQSIAYSVVDVMQENSDLIYNFNDGVRNLGFAKAYQDGADTIISLDDDTQPLGDTIQDHLDVLGKKFPVSWMNTTDDIYMRGFPYGLREEAECVFSHGVWDGVYDFDASTQLVLGTQTPHQRRMPVPKGVLFPICVMNVAMFSGVIPLYYQAPMFDTINRFADIWAGIEMKKEIDKLGLCAVTGYAKVKHERASNPFVNLQKEAQGVGMNEQYGEGEYFKMYAKKRKRWKEFLLKT